MRLEFKQSFIKGNIMSLVINTNVASLNAQRQLMNSSNALSTSITRLSSGLRINSAMDASAGKTIADAMNSKLAGMASASRNANDVVSFAQTAEGGLSQTTEVLSRMRDLAGMALNGTLSEDARNSLSDEFSQLKAEASRIAGGTSLNGEKLFELGSGTPKQIAGGTTKLDLGSVALISSGNPDDGILTRSRDGFSLTSDNFDISGARSTDQLQGVVKALDGMLSDVRTARFALGTLQAEAFSQVPGTAMDADPGLYTPSRPSVSNIDRSGLDNLRNTMLQQMGESILSQANNMPQSVLSLLRG